MITIVYITSRNNPLVQYFFDSLAYQTSPEEKASGIEIIFVDRLVDGVAPGSPRHRLFEQANAGRFMYRHVPPKPNVWQGSHRVTSLDWFAASNARNTGIVRAQGDFLVFVDDLSVLTGAWWTSVKQARDSGKVTCGSYRKVKNLKVDNGNITFFSDFPQGVDNRSKLVNGTGPFPCSGNWLYGCSFAAPLATLLQVNGSDEACDGMGFEDCILGIRLANRRNAFQYSPLMLTYESEEDHHLDAIMRRTDKGVSPNDKSHAILAKAMGSDWAENAHLGVGLMGLRHIFQETGEIPVPDGPATDWFDGQAIKDMV